MTEQHKSPPPPARAWNGTVTLQENVQIARDTYRLSLACPPIAQHILPGQFLMLRLAGTSDPLLGRPLALHDVLPGPDAKPQGLQILYLVVGKMTGQLATLTPGAQLEAWGPLGNGFPPTPTQHLLMVAGGIGLAPFLALAREYLGLHAYGDPPRQVPPAKKVTLCYGARTAEYLAGVEDLRRCGVEVRLSTDDGSAGHHGPVTDLIPAAVEQSPLAARLVCCGPEPMMATAAEVARQLGLRDAQGNWDYRRTCLDGPVFDAQDVDFQRPA
jgi:dihydroorotate dehydrogenase electron transfer subunit